MGLLITAIITTIVLLGILSGVAIYLRYRARRKYTENYNSSSSYSFDRDDNTEKLKPVVPKKVGNKWLLLPLIAPLALTMLLGGAFCKVNANEVGIIYDDRHGILTETLDEGFQGKSIFYHITPISTSNRIKTIKDTFSQTSDGQPVIIDVSLIYKIEKQNAGKFYKVTNAVDISNEQMFTLVKQALQEETSKFDIFALLSTNIEEARAKFQLNLQESLLTDYHITLVKASFDDVDAGEKVEEILKRKAEAEQLIEIAQKEAEAELIKAENEKEVAKRKAEITKTLAEAEAEAIKLKGNADAEAANAYVAKIQGMIDNLYKSLNHLDNEDPSDDVNVVSYQECTDMILSIVFYDTWDGKLPEVLTSESLSALIGGLISKENEAETAPELTQGENK